MDGDIITRWSSQNCNKRRKGCQSLPSPWVIDGVGIDIAAFDALAVLVEFMGVSIGASGPEIIIGHVPNDAAVAAPAPTVGFASGGAAIAYPVAIGASAYHVKFVQIEFLGIVGTMKTSPHRVSFFLDSFDAIERNEIFCTKLGLHSAYENSTFFPEPTLRVSKNDGGTSTIVFLLQNLFAAITPSNDSGLR